MLKLKLLNEKFRLSAYSLNYYCTGAEIYTKTTRKLYTDTEYYNTLKVLKHGLISIVRIEQNYT